MKKMKTIILCGGLGTRLGIETKKIPKPMVKINNKPILEHIIEQVLTETFLLILQVCQILLFLYLILVEKILTKNLL